MVSQAPPRPRKAGFPMERARRLRAASAFAAARASHEMPPAPNARRNRILERLRRARALEGSRTRAVSPADPRHDPRSSLLASRSQERTLRRQLQLAWTDL